MGLPVAGEILLVLVLLVALLTLVHLNGVCRQISICCACCLMLIPVSLVCKVLLAVSALELSRVVGLLVLIQLSNGSIRLVALITLEGVTSCSMGSLVNLEGSAVPKILVTGVALMLCFLEVDDLDVISQLLC